MTDAERESTGPESTEPESQDRRSDAERKAARSRRLDEIFGDTLPETTRDERDPASPEAERGSDRWLREQVPPHHGS